MKDVDLVCIKLLPYLPLLCRLIDCADKLCLGFLFSLAFFYFSQLETLSLGASGSELNREIPCQYLSGCDLLLTYLTLIFS